MRVRDPVGLGEEAGREVRVVGLHLFEQGEQLVLLCDGEGEQG